MNERLLQYIWQFQYFNSKELITTEGEELVILHPGIFNTHQGPDFIEGKIRINKNIWVGNIELHIFSSDWRKHSHDKDANYDNVILHVVWTDDEPYSDRRFPTLVLSDRVPKLLLQQYDSWMQNDHFIPCASHDHDGDHVIWVAWKERLLVERLDRKSLQIGSMLEATNFHWEQVLWTMMARNFGLYVNADAFEEIAASLPYNLVLKHRNQIHQLEALLFGQAGLLEEIEEEKYAVMLKKEYNFLKNKYDLHKIELPVFFLRMRPACFPTVRLAQLAMLMHSVNDLLSIILKTENIVLIKCMLNVTANDYWHYHFRFGQAGNYHPKTLGAAMVNSLLINTVVPLLYAYGKYRKEDLYAIKAINWIMDLPAENNSVTTKFHKLGIRNKNASDSQALLELKNFYCDHRRCLDCAVGNSLLKN